MLKNFCLVFLLFFALHSIVLGQPWTFNFGVSQDNLLTANTVSTTFLATPTSGISRVRIGSAGGGFYLDNQSISFGKDAYLRIVAPTSTSVNKFSIYDYTGGKSFVLRFALRLGDASGGSTATSGTFYVFAGDGASYNSNSGFTSADIFTGLRFVFAAAGVCSTSYRTGGGWTLLSTSAIALGNTYNIDIIGNNSAAAITYANGAVAVNKVDIYVNGTLVGDDLAKGSLAADVNIDSFMMYGESSTSNVANMFVDEIIFSNSIVPETSYPVELTSFSANTINGKVKLNWSTATEVNNNGFDVQRSTDQNTWKSIGFVSGVGNSNNTQNYSYTDNSVQIGTYYYRLKQVDNDGTFSYNKAIEVKIGTPENFSLEQNYPNPFNPGTVISYSIPQTAKVELQVYSLTGQLVKTLVNETKEAGYYTASFNGAGLSSGLYIYQLKAGNVVQTRKMTLLK